MRGRGAALGAGVWVGTSGGGASVTVGAALGIASIAPITTWRSGGDRWNNGSNAPAASSPPPAAAATILRRRERRTPTAQSDVMTVPSVLWYRRTQASPPR